MFEKFLVPHLACDNHIKHSHCVYYVIYLYIFQFIAEGPEA